MEKVVKIHGKSGQKNGVFGFPDEIIDFYAIFGQKRAKNPVFGPPAYTLPGGNRFFGGTPPFGTPGGGYPPPIGTPRGGTPPGPNWDPHLGPPGGSQLGPCIGKTMYSV